MTYREFLNKQAGDNQGAYDAGYNTRKRMSLLNPFYWLSAGLGAGSAGSTGSAGASSAAVPVVGPVIGAVPAVTGSASGTVGSATGTAGSVVEAPSAAAVGLAGSGSSGERGKAFAAGYKDQLTDSVRAARHAMGAIEAGMRQKLNKQQSYSKYADWESFNSFATTYTACMNKVASIVKSAEDPRMAREYRGDAPAGVGSIPVVGFRAGEYLNGMSYPEQLMNNSNKVPVGANGGYERIFPLAASLTMGGKPGTPYTNAQLNAQRQRQIREFLARSGTAGSPQGDAIEHDLRRASNVNREAKRNDTLWKGPAYTAPIPSAIKNPRLIDALKQQRALMVQNGRNTPSTVQPA